MQTFKMSNVVNKKKEPKISFDAWFASLGKPPHHKIGMLAYANTKTKHTKEKWNRIFDNY